MGIFPDVWKLARVTPIFKSGSKSKANNYRPISVISVFSRILERIVQDQVHEYLKANKVLTMSQSAFQKLCLTITSLIDSTDYWYENIDHKQLNLAIFLNLKKAFDTVDHKILLEKLRKYGIRELSGDWFQSYLENRRQYCAANGYESSSKAPFTLYQIAIVAPRFLYRIGVLFISCHSYPVQDTPQIRAKITSLRR